MKQFSNGYLLLDNRFHLSAKAISFKIQLPMPICRGDEITEELLSRPGRCTQPLHLRRSERSVNPSEFLQRQTTHYRVSRLVKSDFAQLAMGASAQIVLDFLIMLINGKWKKAVSSLPNIVINHCQEAA